jgi:flavin reductase (DIM6/NTAB) family NADH-FMN oxidoreductase RutF
MSITSRSRKAIQKVIFGDTLLPQEFSLGLQEPQTEVAVWLHGTGEPLDITWQHTMACADPFTICIRCSAKQMTFSVGCQSLSLKFCERTKKRRVLGEIGLKLTKTLLEANSELLFFEARSSANYCLPKFRLAAHYLLQEYLQWRSTKTSEMKMSFLEKRAAMVMFIRPHPISLGTVSSEEGENIFPMNIMGDLGDGYVGFALKNSRMAAPLVRSTGRIALSNLPMPQAPLAFQLAANHTKRAIDFSQLPFATRMSQVFRVPVPTFAQRVRELEIESVHLIGSHVFFVARVLHEEKNAESLVVNVVHGFYQSLRLKGHHLELETALAEDRKNKHTPYNPSVTDSLQVDSRQVVEAGTARQGRTNY